ncbi:hypothetical protein FB45DRAFT_1023260 [Roridomyces roridus]|uniref:Uncharacterized protein n=1 Tax=Roridomyces roridus TaxID=1738132 RepID=A0AAD7C423_9AGAR|nr:hypothetical protein FB45DRAFT_1023260 [Roridomyces roridus]
MNSTNAALPASPSALKHIEKQIIKEQKTEASQVKHTLKEVDAAEKALAKAGKSVKSAEKKNVKLSKQEASTAKALNKAEHAHDVATTELASSERDVKFVHQQDIKMHADLDAKKARAEQVVQQQKAHDDIHDVKLREVREAAEAGNQ